MAFRAIGLLLFVVVASASAQYKEEYFDQIFDHFNPANDKGKTFKQRYLINDDHWSSNKKGPIFFYAGNEGPIDAFFNNTGFVLEIAPHFGALVLYAEHRFYGKSLPFGASESLKWPHVGSLTVEQALADYAKFLTDFKKERNCFVSGVDLCPVIAFGGSYGGMLAAYMRFKYPNVVTGAIAASAPLRLSDSPEARHRFWSDVTKDFKNANARAPEIVKQAFVDMSAAFARGDLDLVSRTFRLCDGIKNAKDFRHLQLFVRNAFTLLAMMDYPYPATFMASLPGHPVNFVADLLVKAETPMKGLAAAAALVYNGTQGHYPCLDMYKKFVECADPTGCGTGNDALAWDFQACYQIALAYGSNNVTDMFPDLPWTDDMKAAYCRGKWGVEPNGEEYATRFWGSHVFHSSNIVFSNGDLDPWGSAGILQPDSRSPSILPVLVVGGAHHLDLRPSDPRDPPGVKSARTKEIFAIEQWLKEHRKK